MHATFPHAVQWRLPNWQYTRIQCDCIISPCTGLVILSTCTALAPGEPSAAQHACKHILLHHVMIMIRPSESGRLPYIIHRASKHWQVQGRMPVYHLIGWVHVVPAVAFISWVLKNSMRKSSSLGIFLRKTLLRLPCFSA